MNPRFQRRSGSGDRPTSSRPSRPSSASTTRPAATWTPIASSAGRHQDVSGDPRTPPDDRKSPVPILRPKRVPSEPQRAPISLADGLRAIRNRGRSGGSGRRARGWSQARRAFPAGMKRSVQSRHFKPCGAMVGAVWGCKTLRPPRCPRKRRRVAQAPGCVSFCRVCGLPSPDGLTGAARGHGGGVGSDPPQI